ncbi:cation-transporting P-type ATPase [Hymenobacter humi]
MGPNAIVHEAARSRWVILRSQFASALVLLMLLAAGVSFFLGEGQDGAAILVVIFVNAAIGYYMEVQAQVSMEALQQLALVLARVVRDGLLTSISAEAVVPGDVLFLEAGDLVPADATLLDTAQLLVNESALTGESLPAEKQPAPLPPGLPLAEQTNAVFKGTSIVKGNAHALVTATGMGTELGRIAHLVQTAEQAATPLEEKLAVFTRTLIKVAVGLVIVVFAAGLLNGQPWLEMVETSIALAVAAVPEGLPIVATLALAQGMLRMARHRVVVKKLAAVETLGGTSIICTDKTGTLTENRITVTGLITPAREVTAGSLPALAESPAPDLTVALRAAVLCNTATVDFASTELSETGDPLETGLLRFAHAGGTDVAALRAAFPKLGEEPFSSETKLMATLHAGAAATPSTVYAKGAVEELLPRCTALLQATGRAVLDEATRGQWLQRADALAATGLRVLGVAYKETTAPDPELLRELVFVGLFTMLDPPRPDVAPAVAEAQSAGIRVVMITGDHPAAARNIAQRLGILPGGADPESVLVGRDMAAYEQLDAVARQRWAATRVFARVSPQQKLDLIRVLQDAGEVVGMTGDGVNDAPALKQADIGIAMGLRGTQVAQEVADMVLQDDAFPSIVLAIRQGRTIFENIRKFVMYLLSCNLSELLVIGAASVMNLHFQLVPLQILFINLVTDVLPALALGVTPGSVTIMQQRPRPTAEALLTRPHWQRLLVYAGIIGLTSLGAVLISHFVLHEGEQWNPALCNNILFLALVLGQLAHVFNLGTPGLSLARNEVVRNPYAWYATGLCLLLVLGVYSFPLTRQALDLYPLSGWDGLLAGSAGLLVLVLGQLYHYWFFPAVAGLADPPALPPAPPWPATGP